MDVQRKKAKKQIKAGRPISGKDDKRQHILKAGSEILSKMGLEGVSTRAVCAKAGVTSPTLYHYFPDKDALLGALVNLAFDEFLEHKKTAKKTSDSLKNYREAWLNFIQFTHDKPEHFRAMAKAILSGQMPESGFVAYNALLNLSRDLAKEYELSVSADVAAQLILTTAFGICSWRLGMPKIKWDPKLPDQAFHVLIKSIVKQSK